MHLNRGVRSAAYEVKHYFSFSLLFLSLKVEYDKLANEKTEMQRHYVMVRAAIVKLWISFNATSSLLPQVNSHRWCSCGVSTAQLGIVDPGLWFHWIRSCSVGVWEGVVKTPMSNYWLWGVTTTLFGSETLFITLLHPSQHTQHDPLGVNDWSADFVHESEGFLDSVFKLLNSPQVNCGVIQTLLTHSRASQTWGDLMQFFSNHKDNRLLAGSGDVIEINITILNQYVTQYGRY